MKLKSIKKYQKKQKYLKKYNHLPLKGYAESGKMNGSEDFNGYIRGDLKFQKTGKEMNAKRGDIEM